MPSYPVDPLPCEWQLPEPRTASDEQELVGIGADLAPGTMLAAYCRGLFPMGVTLPNGDEALGWWSPNPRGVLRPTQVHISRSLKRSMRRFEFSVDLAFGDVVAACADPSRPQGWIDSNFIAAYQRLFDLGWAHSIEVWETQGLGTRRLVGGLFGVMSGGFFAAESKFHHATDASKAAVVHLCRLLTDDGLGEHRIIDVQWATPHLESLGVQAVARDSYLDYLPTALGTATANLRGDFEPQP